MWELRVEDETFTGEEGWVKMVEMQDEKWGPRDGKVEIRGIEAVDGVLSRGN